MASFSTPKLKKMKQPFKLSALTLWVATTALILVATLIVVCGRTMARNRYVQRMQRLDSERAPKGDTYWAMSKDIRYWMILEGTLDPAIERLYAAQAKVDAAALVLKADYETSSGSDGKSRLSYAEVIQKHGEFLVAQEHLAELLAECGAAIN